MVLRGYLAHHIHLVNSEAKSYKRGETATINEPKQTQRAKKPKATKAPKAVSAYCQKTTKGTQAKKTNNPDRIAEIILQKTRIINYQNQK